MWIPRVSIGTIKRYGEYYDDFPQYLWMSMVMGTWILIRELVRKATGLEERTVMMEVGRAFGTVTGNIETPRAWDIDGDGVVNPYQATK
jgi:hypothetical protein